MKKNNIEWKCFDEQKPFIDIDEQEEYSKEIIVFDGENIITDCRLDEYGNIIQHAYCYEYDQKVIKNVTHWIYVKDIEKPQIYTQ
jgi:hypothetical protein